MLLMVCVFLVERNTSLQLWRCIIQKWSWFNCELNVAWIVLFIFLTKECLLDSIWESAQLWFLTQTFLKTQWFFKLEISKKNIINWALVLAQTGRTGNWIRSKLVQSGSILLSVFHRIKPDENGMNWTVPTLNNT